MEHGEPVIGGAQPAVPEPPSAVTPAPRAGVEPEPVAVVPAGSPPRGSVRPGTPFEKIRAGLVRL